jgi:hypothetical protein
MTLCVALQPVVPKLSIYFLIDPVWKLLVTPSYLNEWVLTLLQADHLSGTEELCWRSLEYIFSKRVP